jgi:hypothetical protein
MTKNSPKNFRSHVSSKERFLTVRWNNLLSLGLGLPTLIYVIFAFSNTAWLEREGLIGLAIFGALF